MAGLPKKVRENSKCCLEFWLWDFFSWNPCSKSFPSKTCWDTLLMFKHCDCDLSAWAEEVDLLHEWKWSDESIEKRGQTSERDVIEERRQKSTMMTMPSVTLRQNPNFCSKNQFWLNILQHWIRILMLKMNLLITWFFVDKKLYFVTVCL